MAHQANGKAVMKLYGFTVGKTTEVDCVTMLMERYVSLNKGCNA
jgi:hypothetical protein